MKETNFNVVETGVTEYTASNGEFVKSSGDKVVLPSPEQDAIVAVRDVGQNLILETPTGLIIDEAEKRLGRSEAAYLISDGTDWYTVQDSDVIRGVIPDSVVSRPEDNNDFISNAEAGGIFELKTDWKSIGARISKRTQDAPDAFLLLYDEDTTEYNQIDQIDISGLSSGDTFSFDEVNLTSGDEIVIYLFNSGNEYQLGQRDDGDSYPYEGEDINIIGRWSDGPGDGNIHAINDIGNPDNILD